MGYIGTGSRILRNTHFRQCQREQRKQEEKGKFPRDITPPGMMTHVYFRKYKKGELFGSWFRRCQSIMIEEKWSKAAPFVAGRRKRK